MRRVVHFEFHSADSDRSQAYFEKLFGWKVSRWEGPMDYRLCQTGEGDGIDGAIMASQDGQPRTVNVVEVEAIGAATKQAAELGGTVVVEKMSIPGVGYASYAVDPAGVLFGMFQPDESVTS